MYHLTPTSGNSKTGRIPVTTSTGRTCPPTCPFNSRNEGGCYAENGKLAMHWRKVSAGTRGTEWTSFLAQLDTTLAAAPARQLWRHNQAGDLPGTGARINRRQLDQLAATNHRHAARGWTYTHKPVLESESEKHAAANRAAIAQANQKFTVNLSGNSPAHADQLAELGIAPVVCVLPANATGKLKTPAGRPIIICPAQTSDSTTCATCGLCAVRDPRRPIVGFIAHGSGAKRADAVATATPATATR